MAQPGIVSITESDDSDRSGTTLAMRLPSTTAGYTLVAVIGQDNPAQGFFTTPAGWTEARQDKLGGYCLEGVIFKKATGSEGSTVDIVFSDADDVCAVVFEINTAADPDLYPIEIGPDAGSILVGTNPHAPPAMSPSQGNFNYLFLAICHIDRNDVGITAYPSGYINTDIINAGTGGTGNAIAYGTKAVTTATETPGNFEVDTGRRDHRYLIAIHGDDIAEDARTTQAALLLLDESTAEDVRGTQAAVLFAHTEVVDARISQAVILVLETEIPCIIRRCQVWKITRIDGTVYRYTTHDRDVSFFNEVYIPCDSLTATAVEAGVMNKIGTGDIEIGGLISGDGITESDLSNGLFDGAIVEVWRVPWDDPTLASDSPVRILYGVLGSTSQNKTTYTAEVFSNAAKLGQMPLLDVFTAACRFEPGDGNCPIDIEALTVTGSVEATASRVAIFRQSYRQFFDSTLTGANPGSLSDSISSVGYDGYYNNGLLTWLSGNNINLQSEVKTYVGGVVTLWAAMQFEIEVADQYKIAPGCNKSEADHKDKFGFDADSFGGFVDVPGSDAIIRGPDR